MRKHRAAEPPPSGSDLPEVVVVELKVLPPADARAFRARIAATQRARRRLAGLALALVLAIAAAAAIWLSGRNAERPLVNPVARERGPAGVAAAYGYPLDCLTITVVMTDRTYARADFNHLSPCGRYMGYPTAIFHYASGRWRPLLDAISYQCPVDSLPTDVQTALGVCARASGENSEVHVWHYR